MSFTPLRSKSRDLSAWFATRPDLFESERSPRKTMTWAFIAMIMVVLALLVYLNPLATVELMGGRIRSGLAIVAAFVMPPVIFVVCIVMIFVGAKRWRVKGGGVLRNAVIHGYAAGFPIEQVLSSIRTGRADSAGVIAALAALQKNRADERLLTIWTSETDRAMYVGVLRVDGNKVWIDSEPFAVDPNRYFDARQHDLAAARGRMSIETEAL